MAFVKRIAGATALGVAMLTGYGLSVIPAQAGLIGAEVTYEYSLSDTSTIDFSLPTQTITLATSLVDSVAGGITTTFTDNEIIITNNFPSPFNATPFNGPSYLFSGVTVTNVTIDSASSPDFLGVPSFMANDIMVNFSGLSASDGAQLILDVTTTSASALYPEGKNDGSRDQEDGEAGKRTAPARGQAGAAG